MTRRRRKAHETADTGAKNSQREAQVAPKAARAATPEARALMRRIDDVLDVDWVEWRLVDLFVMQLEHVLEDVLDFGDVNVALYFLDRMPLVFDRVHDETEMADFCSDLGRAIVKLARGDMAVAVAETMLDAFVTDRYGAMSEFPEIIKGIATTPQEKSALAKLYRERASRAERFVAQDLLNAAAALAK